MIIAESYEVDYTIFARRRPSCTWSIPPMELVPQAEMKPMFQHSARENRHSRHGLRSDSLHKRPGVGYQRNGEGPKSFDPLARHSPAADRP